MMTKFKVVMGNVQDDFYFLFVQLNLTKSVAVNVEENSVFKYVSKYIYSVLYSDYKKSLKIVFLVKVAS